MPERLLPFLFALTAAALSACSPLVPRIEYGRPAEYERGTPLEYPNFILSFLGEEVFYEESDGDRYPAGTEVRFEIRTPGKAQILNITVMENAFAPDPFIADQKCFLLWLGLKSFYLSAPSKEWLESEIRMSESNLQKLHPTPGQLVVLEAKSLCLCGQEAEKAGIAFSCLPKPEVGPMTRPGSQYETSAEVACPFGKTPDAFTRPSFNELGEQ